MGSSGLDFFLPSSFRGEFQRSIRGVASLLQTQGNLSVPEFSPRSFPFFPFPLPYNWSYLWHHPKLHIQSLSASRVHPMALQGWALAMPAVLKPFQPPPQNRPDTPPPFHLAQSQNFCLPRSTVRPAAPFLLGWERWREVRSLQLNRPLAQSFSPYVYMPYVNRPYMCQQIVLRHLF